MSTKRKNPVLGMKSELTYAETITWIAKNDKVDDKIDLDVDFIYDFSTTRLVSDVFGVDRRVVASDVVNARVKDRDLEALIKKCPF